LKTRFLSPASTELDEAIKYYNQQVSGLGYRFIEEISDALELITFMPQAWTKVGKHTRRYLLKGFPYAILYVCEQNEIIITAIADLHRYPDHFMDRIW
jgi:hypothetical protein